MRLMGTINRRAAAQAAPSHTICLILLRTKLLTMFIAQWQIFFHWFWLFFLTSSLCNNGNSFETVRNLPPEINRIEMVHFSENRRFRMRIRNSVYEYICWFRLYQLSPFKHFAARLQYPQVQLIAWRCRWLLCIHRMSVEHLESVSHMCVVRRSSTTVDGRWWQFAPQYNFKRRNNRTRDRWSAHLSRLFIHSCSDAVFKLKQPFSRMESDVSIRKSEEVSIKNRITGWNRATFREKPRAVRLLVVFVFCAESHRSVGRTKERKLATGWRVQCGLDWSYATPSV